MSILLLGLLLATATPAPAPAPDPIITAYASAAVGVFSSVAQHRADPRHDEAEAVIARIWPDRTDGLWLYQEQTVLTRPGITPAEARRTPYVQRIAHIVRLPDGRLRSDNLVIRNPARFIGLGRPGYDGPLPGPDDLGDAGCHTIITPVATGHFTATTEHCANHDKGAATMLSLTIINPDSFANWDRGFDGAGKLVWGPEAGGSIFRRLP